MTNQPLASTVFVLRNEGKPRDNVYLGRAAHKLALELIGLIDPALGTEMHNHDGFMPITISDLFQSDVHFHWMRISALRADLVDVLDALATRAEDLLQLDGFFVVRALNTQHDWCGSTSADELLRNQWRPVSNLKLEFASPTSFKSVGLYRPLPDASLVFKSLYERWQRLVQVPLPFTPNLNDFETFTSHLVSIDHYDLKFMQVGMKQGSVPAFHGLVTYHIEANNSALEKRDPHIYQRLMADRKQYASLLNLLAHFGFYSGVGIKTAQGMGMVRAL